MRAILKSLCLIAITIVPTVGSALQACATRDVVVERLSSGYGESFVGGGLQSETKIFEVWFSEDEGTWTILMTKSDWTSCIMASGTNWREAMPSAKIPAGIPG